MYDPTWLRHHHRSTAAAPATCRLARSSSNDTHHPTYNTYNRWKTSYKNGEVYEKSRMTAATTLLGRLERPPSTPKVPVHDRRTDSHAWSGRISQGKERDKSVPGSYFAFSFPPPSSWATGHQRDLEWAGFGSVAVWRRRRHRRGPHHFLPLPQGERLFFLFELFVWSEVCCLTRILPLPHGGRLSSYQTLIQVWRGKLSCFPVFSHLVNLSRIFVSCFLYLLGKQENKKRKKSTICFDKHGPKTKRTYYDNGG